MTAQRRHTPRTRGNLEPSLEGLLGSNLTRSHAVGDDRYLRTPAVRSGSSGWSQSTVRDVPPAHRSTPAPGGDCAYKARLGIPGCLPTCDARGRDPQLQQLRHALVASPDRRPRPPLPAPGARLGPAPT